MASTVKDLIEISGLADCLPVNPTVFKEFTVQEALVLPEAKPGVEQILKVIARAGIINTRVIRTPVGRSLEGQILSGFKLIVEGEIIQKIEYVADKCNQSVHAVQFNIPFSTFIVLPANYTIGTPVAVTAYIEDLYVELIDKRTIFKNVILLLDAF